MDLISNEEKKTRALLISVNTGNFDAESSLRELSELAKTAGADTVGTVLQNMPKIESATFVGTGKLCEISEICKNQEIDLLIFDDELTPTQIRNIEDSTGTRTIDRTMLILDIFALHAKTKEGKLQVELAQLKYMLPRLTGKGVEMSRLGGGIGTRGPGESKLETDKRHIRRKMETLKEQLKDVEHHRDTLRKSRIKSGIITTAIVGYTNAGKSTLMNYLTKAGVLAEDKLFATLYPTSRSLKLPNGVTVMLIDTVGLVRRLPHHLVDAFKSTLEEAAQADIILNVCDASSEEASLHLSVTKDLLQSLGCGDTPIISVFNKCDKISDLSEIPFRENSVMISAKEGIGIDKLLKAVEENLPVRVKKVKMLLPFSLAGTISEIRKEATLISEEYTEEGVLAEAIIDEKFYQRIKEYII